MRPTDLLKVLPQGLYCPPADVFIDPVRPVERALITHGHSDHARAGHGAVLATPETLAIMGVRYGANFAGSTQAVRYGESVTIGDTKFSFAPAGHVLGSAQILVEAGPLRIVVSGDYKRAPDPTCAPFQVVPCDVFVTEATFGLPVFRHPPLGDEIQKLLHSLQQFPEQTHLIGAYALGKAQRLMALIREAGYEKPIYIHGALENLTRLYQAHGVDLGDIRKISAEDGTLAGAIVMCPPSAIQDRWTRRFADPITAFASGWMRIRARARQRGVELPLVVSDHADWDDLCRTIRETGAGEIWVTHGAEDALVHWCHVQGLRAQPLHMVGYGDEGEAEPALPHDSQQASGAA